MIDVKQELGNAITCLKTTESFIQREEPNRARFFNKVLQITFDHYRNYDTGLLAGEGLQICNELYKQNREWATTIAENNAKHKLGSRKSIRGSKLRYINFAIDELLQGVQYLYSRDMASSSTKFFGVAIYISDFRDLS